MPDFPDPVVLSPDAGEKISVNPDSFHSELNPTGMSKEPPTVSHKLADTTATNNNGNHDSRSASHHPNGAVNLLNGGQNPTGDGFGITDKGQVTDLGWHDVGDSGNLPEPLIGKTGLGPDPDDDPSSLELGSIPMNEELFTLIRRFNKQMSHVKCMNSLPPGIQLDLDIASNEVFTPIKFRTHLERFYMTVFVGLISAYKHLVRLRSWREYKRTAAFFLVYLTAWTFDCLLSTIFAVLLMLLTYPPSRSFLFPYAPPALIDPESARLKKPMAKVLASDSMTGAPESHPGEAIELEAHSFVNSIIELAIGMASNTSPEDIANIKDKTGGEFTKTEHDKTKKAVSDAVWEEALPVMHMIGGLSDLYERVGNVLEGRWPFGRETRRARVVMATGLVTGVVGCWFLTAYLLLKGVGFVVGLLLFGDPVHRRMADWLDRVRPGWENYLSLKATILQGIPSNAQLALTLLRIGERNRAPLPPPPRPNDPLPMEAHPTAGEGLDDMLNVPPEEVNDAIQPSPATKAEADGHLRERTKSKGPSRIMAVLKNIARGAVHTVRGADRLSAHVRVSQSARYRAGVVRTGRLPARCTGPVRFPARRDGKRGYVAIYYDGLTEGYGEELKEAVLGWIPGEVPEEGDEKAIGQEGENMQWRMTIGDVHEIQKIGGLGWKSKILVGWATDDEITDGLILRDKTGTEYHITAISLRDALFNRLIAVGGQMWEAW